jgi:hypothetical protein
MSREQLLERLRALLLQETHGHMDPERSHSDADDALIAYINDAQVTHLYGQLTRWCA